MLSICFYLFVGTYWLYSSVSLVTIIFGIFFLPETKGKRLDQISDGFNKDNKIKNINPDPAQEKNSFKAWRTVEKRFKIYGPTGKWI